MHLVLLFEEWSPAHVNWGLFWNKHVGWSLKQSLKTDCIFYKYGRYTNVFVNYTSVADTCINICCYETWKQYIYWFMIVSFASMPFHSFHFPLMLFANNAIPTCIIKYGCLLHFLLANFCVWPILLKQPANHHWHEISTALCKYALQTWWLSCHNRILLISLKFMLMPNF